MDISQLQLQFHQHYCLQHEITEDLPFTITLEYTLSRNFVNFGNFCNKLQPITFAYISPITNQPHYNKLHNKMSDFQEYVSVRKSEAWKQRIAQEDRAMVMHMKKVQ